jgi:MerR family transcriptional regulator, heat shock protein HspR
MASNDRREPRHAIGVAAHLVGTTPHTLRAYEKAGLIKPSRQGGRNRLYSDQDIELLRHITSLTQRGVTLDGIKVKLGLGAKR